MRNTVVNKKVALFVDMLSDYPEVIEVLKEQVDEVTLAKVICEVLKSDSAIYSSYKMEQMGRLRELTKTLSETTKIEILKQLPWMLSHYAGEQTLEMCRAAVKAAYDDSPYNVNHVFQHVEKMDMQMVKMVVATDFRCYKYIKDEYKTDEVKELAVRSDGVVLKDIPGPHSDRLVELAIKSWPKAVRWAQCPSLEKMQLLAIELNMQAMPDNPVSQKVIDRYKELCIQNNYFDETWCPKFNLTQYQLYCMYQARYEWIESYKIFNLLDEEHKKLALKEKLVKYTIKMKMDELLKIKDTGLICMMLEYLSGDTIRDYFIKVGDTMLKDLLKRDGMLLEYILVSRKTPNIEMIAVQSNPKAIKFVQNWTPEMKEVLKKQLETV